MTGQEYLATEVQAKALQLADLLDRNNELAAKNNELIKKMDDLAGQLNAYEEVLTKAQRNKLGLDPESD